MSSTSELSSLSPVPSHAKAPDTQSSLVEPSTQPAAQDQLVTEGQENELEREAALLQDKAELQSSEPHPPPQAQQYSPNQGSQPPAIADSSNRRSEEPAGAGEREQTRLAVAASPLSTPSSYQFTLCKYVLGGEIKGGCFGRLFETRQEALDFVLVNIKALKGVDPRRVDFEVEGCSVPDFFWRAVMDAEFAKGSPLGPITVEVEEDLEEKSRKKAKASHPSTSNHAGHQPSSKDPQPAFRPSQPQPQRNQANSPFDASSSAHPLQANARQPEHTVSPQVPFLPNVSTYSPSGFPDDGFGDEEGQLYPDDDEDDDDDDEHADATDYGEDDEQDQGSLSLFPQLSGLLHLQEPLGLAQEQQLSAWNLPTSVYEQMARDVNQIGDMALNAMGGNGVASGSGSGSGAGLGWNAGSGGASGASVVETKKKPKRQLSAYNVFYGAEYLKLKAERPEMDNKEIIREVARRWADHESNPKKANKTPKYERPPTLYSDYYTIEYARLKALDPSQTNEARNKTVALHWATSPANPKTRKRKRINSHEPDDSFSPSGGATEAALAEIVARRQRGATASTGMGGEERDDIEEEVQA